MSVENMLQLEHSPITF